MGKNIPRLIRTDNPDWDCLLFRNGADNLNFRLLPTEEYALYDKNGMPVDVLPWPSTLNLDQIASGYQRVNHDVADAVRELLNPRLEYPTSSESADRYRCAG